MAMRRLIDDKRKKRAIWSLTILTLAIVLSITVWHKILNINEQWRSEGRDVLNALQEKIDWLDKKMDLLHDAEEGEKKMSEIAKCLESKDSATMEDIYFVRGTRMEEYMREASDLTQKCQRLLEDLAESRKNLSYLSNTGKGLLAQLSELDNSEMGQEIKNTREKAEKYHFSLKEICERDIVFSLDYRPNMEECQKITRLADRPDWKQHEKAHDDYVAWNKTVKDSVEGFYELERSFNETFFKLNNLKLDREKTLKTAMDKINGEVNVASPLLVKGKNLCDDSCKSCEDELRKMQSTFQTAFDTISSWRELHGDYVADNQIATFRNYLKDFIDFRSKSYKRLNEFSSVAVEKRSKVELALSKTTNLLVSLKSKGNDVSDDLFLQKCGEGLNCASELQSLCGDFDKNLTSLADYLAAIQSSAVDKVNTAKTLLKDIERDFPDWTAEGRKIDMEINGFRQDFARCSGDLEKVQKSFENYVDNGYSGKMASLGRACSAIQNQLTNGYEMCAPMRSCSNGRELKALTQRRNKVKSLLENVEQRTRNLPVERDSALKYGYIFRIERVPYSNSFASELQQGKRHFDFALDIPGSGHHKIELKFKKGQLLLFRRKSFNFSIISNKYKIETKCKISGNHAKLTDVVYRSDVCEVACFPDNSAVISWNDLSKEFSWSIVLEGNFPSGKYDFDLELSFTAKDGKGNILDNNEGNWQFQFEETKFGSKEKKTNDNFTIGTMVDEFAQSLLVRKRVQ